MAAPFGNKNAAGSNGGGRKGYMFEKDQEKQMRRQVNKLFAKLEAFDKGLLTERQAELFKMVLPVYLKSMDKLHANKQHLEHSGEIASKIIKLDE